MQQGRSKINLLNIPHFTISGRDLFACGIYTNRVPASDRRIASAGSPSHPSLRSLQIRFMTPVRPVRPSDIARCDDDADEDDGDIP